MCILLLHRKYLVLVVQIITIPVCFDGYIILFLSLFEETVIEYVLLGKYSGILYSFNFLLILKKKKIVIIIKCDYHQFIKHNLLTCDFQLCKLLKFII